MTLQPTYQAGLVLQYLDEATGDWATFGYAHDLGTLVRTRRFALGPRKSVVTRKVRLVKKGGPDYGTARFSVDTLRFWREGPELSPVRVFGFSFDDQDQTYMLVRTDRNIEVYRRDLRMASIPCPHGVDQVTTVMRAAVLDTLLQFHADVQTHRITRQGAHDQWDSRPLAFETLPLFDYTGARAGGVNEVQQLTFKDYAGGDTFNITLEGEVTDSIVYAAGDNSAAIQAGLEGLANVGEGNVLVTLSAADTYRIEFTGELRCDDIGEIAPKTLVSDNGLVIGATLTQGREGGEPIVSDARGWAACGTFYQQRLWMGGLRSRPQTVLASRLGDWFKFKSHGSSQAISGDLDTDETTRVRAIFPGRRLQFFTSSAEFYIDQRPIVPPPTAERAGRRGIEAGIQPADLGDASLIICAGGQAVAECLWDDQLQSFRTDYVSKFATHLCAGTKKSPVKLVDMGFRRALTPIDADRLIMPRSDGRAVVLHTLRQDGVTGFVGWSTQGRYLAAGADLSRTEYLAVRRDLAGGPEITIERLDSEAFMDCQVGASVPEGGQVSQIAAPHLNGLTVDVYADGADRGEVEVVAGVATFTPPALRQVCAGLHFTPAIVTLPAVLEQDPRAGSEAEPGSPIIALQFGPTGGLVQAGLKGDHLYDVPFERPPTADVGPGEEPFSGEAKVEALGGFSSGAQIMITQPRPGPFELKQVILTVDT